MSVVIAMVGEQSLRTSAILKILNLNEIKVMLPSVSYVSNVTVMGNYIQVTTHMRRG